MSVLTTHLGFRNKDIVPCLWVLTKDYIQFYTNQQSFDQHERPIAAIKIKNIDTITTRQTSHNTLELTISEKRQKTMLYGDMDTISHWSQIINLVMQDCVSTKEELDFILESCNQPVTQPAVQPKKDTRATGGRDYSLLETVSKQPQASRPAAAQYTSYTEQVPQQTPQQTTTTSRLARQPPPSTSNTRIRDVTPQQSATRQPPAAAVPPRQAAKTEAVRRDERQSILLAARAETFNQKAMREYACVELVSATIGRKVSIEEMSDGSVLKAFYECLTEKKVAVTPTADATINSIHLVDALMALAFTQNKLTPEYEAIDVVRGCTPAIVDLIVVMYEVFVLNKLTFQKETGMAALMAWVRLQLKGTGASFTNFGTDFSDGYLFALMIHTRRPDLLKDASVLSPVCGGTFGMGN